MSHYPRVAPRTRPKPAASKAVKLPPLCCAIYQNGKLIGINEQPDPRAAFAAAFNHQGDGFGYSAKPITTKRLLIAARQAEAGKRERRRKAVSHG